MVLSVGVVAGIMIFVFLAALVAVLFCCFGSFFLGAFLVRCFLSCCFGLFLCSWGPGTGIGSCMVVSVPISYDFGCYFLHLMKHI